MPDFDEFDNVCSKCHTLNCLVDGDEGLQCTMCGWVEDSALSDEILDEEETTAMQDCKICGNTACLPKDAPCVICGEPIEDYKAYPPDNLDLESQGEPETNL